MPLPKEIEQASGLLKDKGNLLHDFKRHPAGCGDKLERVLNKMGDNIAEEYQTATAALEFLKEKNDPKFAPVIKATEEYLQQKTMQGKLVMVMDKVLQYQKQNGMIKDSTVMDNISTLWDKLTNAKDVNITELKVRLESGKEIMVIDTLGYASELEARIEPLNKRRDQLNAAFAKIGYGQKLAINFSDSDRKIFSAFAENMNLENTDQVAFKNEKQLVRNV